MSALRAERGPRIGVVDAVRGVACVVMMQWHTADAWLSDAIHGTPAFERARLVGGFAAPFFLFLAGLSLALSTELRPSGARTRAALVRAGWVVVVGYALKLFAYGVDHGALREPRCWPTLTLATLGVGGLVAAFREPTSLGARRRAIAGVLGAALTISAYQHLDGLPRTPGVLVRLDVLHGIGAALASITLLLHGIGRVARTEAQRAAALAVLAIVVALATPHWIGASLRPLPDALADYVARTAADPAQSGARFALFPWLGHALYGAAIGTLLRGAPRTLGSSDVPFVRAPWLLALTAGAIALLVFEPGPTARFVTDRAEALRPVLRLVFYGTTAIAGAGLVAALGRRWRRGYDALSVMGRSSLLVYGAHLELAYGLVGVPLRHGLGWVGWAVGLAILTLLMVALAHRADARARPAPRVPGPGPDDAHATACSEGRTVASSATDPGEGASASDASGSRNRERTAP